MIDVLWWIFSFFLVLWLWLSVIFLSFTDPLISLLFLSIIVNWFTIDVLSFTVTVRVEGKGCSITKVFLKDSKEREKKMEASSKCTRVETHQIQELQTIHFRYIYRQKQQRERSPTGTLSDRNRFDFSWKIKSWLWEICASEILFQKKCRWRCISISFDPQESNPLCTVLYCSLSPSLDVMRESNEWSQGRSWGSQDTRDDAKTDNCVRFSFILSLFTTKFISIET
jgi:hypothetical protein